MIEFGEIKLQHMILLIHPVGIISAKIMDIFVDSNPCYHLFLFFLSHLLAIIPYFIYKSNKNNSIKPKVPELEKENEGIEQSSKSINVRNELLNLKLKLKKDLKREKIFNFFLIGILYFLTYAFFHYINFITNTNNKFYGNISMAMEVFYFSLFNKIILGSNIYKHHVFSMILIMISIIGIYILLIIKYIKTSNDGKFGTIFVFRL